MSRLTPNDIKDTANTLRQSDAAYTERFGFGIREAAAYAVGCCAAIPVYKCAVVPITSGLGIISGFCDTAAAILRYCGADAYVTGRTDIAGYREAYERGADFIFAADDNVFTAFSANNRIYSDNAYATGIGFAAALELMNRGGEDLYAIVLGAGPVGEAAARYLTGRGWHILIYDPVPEKAERLAQAVPGVIIEPNSSAFARYENILCAANAGGFITEADVTEKTKISAPGMPLCVTEGAARIAKVFHNPLELGIAVMLYDCIKKDGGYVRTNNQTVCIQKTKPLCFNQQDKTLAGAFRAAARY